MVDQLDMKNDVKGVKGANINRGDMGLKGDKGMKDIVDSGMDQVQELVGDINFDWKTLLSGIAIVGLIGAVSMLRSGKKSRSSESLLGKVGLGNVGKSIGGMKGGHRASHSHRKSSRSSRARANA